MFRKIKKIIYEEKTYRGFIEECVRKREVWTLMREEGFALADTPVRKMTPFWSSEEEAQNSRFGRWEDTTVECIPLFNYINEVIPYFMIHDLDMVLAYKEGFGIWKTLETIAEDLKKEARRQNISVQEMREEKRKIEQTNERYDHFIAEILDNREVWMLMRDDALVLTSCDGEKCVPLWSCREDAEKARDDDWGDSTAEAVLLCDFLESHIPEYLKDNLKGLVDVHTGMGLHVSLRVISEDLKEGASQRGFDWTEPTPEQSREINAEEMFQNFLNEVIDSRQVWTVFDGDNPMRLSNEEGKWFPVWENEEKAAAECRDEWENCHANAIHLAEFISSWIEYLSEFEKGALIGAGGDIILEITFDNLEKEIRQKAKEKGVPEEELYCEDVKFMRFIWNIVKNERIWILHTEGRVVTVGNQLRNSVPVWSTREDAERECTDQWISCTADSVPLNELISKWFPDLERNNLGIFAIPTPGKGINFQVSEFEEKLLEEIRCQDPKSLILRRNSRQISTAVSSKDYLN